MIRWDWYQSTVLVQDPQDSGLVEHLLRAWPLSDWAPAKNLNGYLYGGQIRRGDRTLCHVCWGGQNGVNCKTTSDESPVLADALRTFGKPHMPTRVDACEDWQEEGFFDSVSAALIEFAKDRRLAIDQRGDWERGQARTLYIGSKSSPVYLCLYEKGYEQGGDAPKDWVRLEVRVAPKREHRLAVARWEPLDAFGASWVPDAIQFFGWDDLVKRAVGTVWRQSDTERARSALVKQYGAIMSQWAQDVGSWDALGPAIQAAMSEAEKNSRIGKKPLATGAATLVTS
jgi:hypothetical protein